MKPTNLKSQNLAYNLISIVVIVFALWLLKDVLVPLIFSGILSILLLPLCVWLEQRRFPRILAISISIIVLVLIFLTIIVVFASPLSEFQEIIPQLTAKAQDLFNEVQNLIRARFEIGKSKQNSELQKYLTEAIKNSSSSITSSINAAFGFLGTLSLVPLYIFLFLLYRNRIRTFLHRIYKNHKVRVDTILLNIKNVVFSYLSGLVLVIFIVGMLNSIGLLIIGIDFAFFFGFLAAVLIVIPYIGIFIGAILPILYALITKDTYTPALLTAGLFVAVQLLEGNLITPYLVGSKVSINSLAAILALLLFSSLWGMAGLVLALPLTAILKVVFDSISFLKPYGYLIGDND